jgi:hypothetical protein
MSFRVTLRCLIAAVLLLPPALAAGPAVAALGQPATHPASALDGKRYVTCWNCHGDGKVTCSWCNGAGRIYQGNGRYKPCSTCSGAGKVKCSSCGGTGVKRQ